MKLLKALAFIISIPVYFICFAFLVILGMLIERKSDYTGDYYGRE